MKENGFIFVRSEANPDILTNTVNLAKTSIFDQQEFERLLAAHQGRLFGFIRSLTGPGTDVDDILQNTNQVLWEKAETFEIGTNFRAWAFQVARFQVLQFREKQRKHDHQVPFSDDLMETLAVRANEKDVSYSRRQQYLKYCLDKLPSRQREVVDRRYFGHESVQTIATILGMKPNAVSQLLFRSRENLLFCIESQLGDHQIKSTDL